MYGDGTGDNRRNSIVVRLRRIKREEFAFVNIGRRVAAGPLSNDEISFSEGYIPYTYGWYIMATNLLIIFVDLARGRLYHDDEQTDTQLVATPTNDLATCIHARCKNFFSSFAIAAPSHHHHHHRCLFVIRTCCTCAREIINIVRRRQRLSSIQRLTYGALTMKKRNEKQN